MTTTYSGTKLLVSTALPATKDLAGFKAIDDQFIAGACALRETPKLNRTWDKVPDENVCDDNTFESKGGAKWDAIPVKFKRIVNDAAQIIYEALEASKDSGSFKLILPNGEIFYFVAQVSMFSLVDGGTKNVIHTSSGELLPQCEPVSDFSGVVA